MLARGYAGSGSGTVILIILPRWLLLVLLSLQESPCYLVSDSHVTNRCS